MENVYFAVAVKGEEFSVYYSEEGLRSVSVFPVRRQATRCGYMRDRNVLYIPDAADTIVFGKVDYDKLSEYTYGGKRYYGYTCSVDMARRFFEGLILHVKDMVPRFWTKNENGEELYRRIWIFSSPDTMKPEEKESYRTMLSDLGQVADEADALAAWEKQQNDAEKIENDQELISGKELLRCIAEGLLNIEKKGYPEETESAEINICRAFAGAFDDISATPVFQEKNDNWKPEKEELLKRICKEFWQQTLEEVAEKAAEEAEKIVGDAIFAWGVSEIKFRWNIARKAKEDMKKWLNQPVLDVIALSSLENIRRAVKKVEDMYLELPYLPESEKVKLNADEIEGAYFSTLAHYYCPKSPEYPNHISRAEEIINEEIDKYFKNHFYPGSRAQLLKRDWSKSYSWSGKDGLRKYLVVCTESKENSEKPVKGTYNCFRQELEKEKERLMKICR